jgi:hypothetical protein
MHPITPDRIAAYERLLAYISHAQTVFACLTPLTLVPAAFIAVDRGMPWLAVTTVGLLASFMLLIALFTEKYLGLVAPRRPMMTNSHLLRGALVVAVWVLSASSVFYPDDLSFAEPQLADVGLLLVSWMPVVLVTLACEALSTHRVRIDAALATARAAQPSRDLRVKDS